MVRETMEIAAVREKTASLGQMITGFANEIGNPLSGLDLYLSTLETILAGPGPLDVAKREQTEEILRSMRCATEKVGRIVHRVLELSRPDRARLAPVQINRTVLDAVPLCHGLLRDGGIMLKTKLAEKSPECGADRVLVELVLLNLVTNAAQALETVEREKTISIGTRLTEAHAVISVEDSGPGVPRELRGRIFDPVFSMKKGGTGIGLSFCRRVAALHSGFVEVGESTLGGAAFRFGIPLGPAGAASSPPDLAT